MADNCPWGTHSLPLVQTLRESSSKKYFAFIHKAVSEVPMIKLKQTTNNFDHIAYKLSVISLKDNLTADMLCLNCRAFCQKYKHRGKKTPCLFQMKQQQDWLFNIGKASFTFKQNDHFYCCLVGCLLVCTNTFLNLCLCQPSIIRSLLQGLCEIALLQMPAMQGMEKQNQHMTKGERERERGRFVNSNCGEGKVCQRYTFQIHYLKLQLLLAPRLQVFSPPTLSRRVNASQRWGVEKMSTMFYIIFAF